MRKISFIFLITLLFSFTSNAQKKYQGLLWEITGNGISEPSYLYGTMHVSNKLAFNVSDSFYYCLDRVKGVGLESSPETWLQEFRDMGSSYNSGNYGSDFYEQAFNIRPPQSDVIYDLLENKNGLMNQILYRFNPGNADYQENTYLDMFIYQAGAKNNKPIYSLETLEEVVDLQMKSLTPDKDKKRDNSNNSYLENNGQKKYVMLEEAYRRGDLDQIDSLSKSDTPTEVYHKYFIVERNKNMVRRMDSIMHVHSLFTGIGAAHLPGEEGAIELLRDMGYTLRPVSTKSTGKSHKMRQKFESLYRSIDFTKSTSTDNFIQVQTPGYLYEMPTRTRGRMMYLCAEPVNGGNFSIIRQFTLGPIFKKDPEYYKTTFDSLIYIATPGELIKKEEIKVNGHIGFNILTKTSKNNYVAYKVFFTPTEIVVFKGSGIGTYIQRPEPQSFFTKLALAPAHSNWNTVSPIYGGAKWEMKGLVSGQDMIDGMNQQKVEPYYQSYDQSSGAYFQVLRYTYNDFEYIEEDSFDLAYLGKTYGDRLGYELVSTHFEPNGKYAYVEQELMLKEDKEDQVESLSLKVVTKGSTFYLMATTADGSDKRKFFDSFDFIAFDTKSEYEEWTDTNMFYSVNTVKKEKIPKLNSGYGSYGYYNKNEEDNSFQSKLEKKMHHNAKTGESIYVMYNKFHDYIGYDSLERFWELRVDRLTYKNQLIVSRYERGEEDGDQTLSFLLSDTGSAKGVLTKMRLHHGVLYTLQTLIDTNDAPSEYVSRFYESFQPKDTLIGRDIFEDKADLFFDHISGDDSLNQVNAKKSIMYIHFDEDDLEDLIEVYNDCEFDEEKEDEQKEDILIRIGHIDTKEAYDFLFAVYDSNSFNSDYQFVVLRSLSYSEKQESYDALKKLLVDNTPFTQSESKLKFFNFLYDSLELTKGFFPDMLDLAQYADYQPYIMELLAYGYQEGVYEYKDFAAEKRSIYRNANIELKRSVANQNEKKRNTNYYSSSYNSNKKDYHTLFLDYYTLMCGFKLNGQQDTEQFFKDVKRIENKQFILEAEIIHHKLGLPIDTSRINSVINDREYRSWAFNRLEKHEMLEYFPDQITQNDMAFALLYASGYDEEEDTVAFIKKVEVFNGKESGYIYFYKRKTEKTKNWMIDYVGMFPCDEQDFVTIGFKSKKGLSVKNEDEIEMTIEKTIDIFELANRKRVDLDGYSYGGWFY
ncbi:MAG: TraB/GumN family protein [Crocinitomicaceae bacterium]|nr:TraB/GumN family protein [Crocinitomicaceae bacterium]